MRSGADLRRGLIAVVLTVVVGGTLAALLIAWSTRASHLSASAPKNSAAAVSASPTSGGAGGATGAPSSGSGSGSAAASAGHAFCDGVAAAAPANGQFAAAAQAAADQRGAHVSLAWWTPQGIQTSGNLPDAPAWSTSKVPLALATIAAGRGETQRSDIQQALRSSDNAAADRLWQALGADDAARASSVTAILRTAGDDRTTVPSTSLATGYSVFGQTRWEPAAQVAFLTQLPCLAGGGQVTSEMGQVEADQRWGLGSRSGAVFKGGWGPTTSGGYTVRQLGWYAGTGGARIPVAIVAEAPSFAVGTELLDAIAAQLG